MNRRDFLQRALAAGALYSGGPLLNLSGAAHAAFAGVSRPILADITLLGGPDFRYLLPPAYQAVHSTYGWRHWQARRRAHALPNVATDWAARYTNDYYHQSHNGVEFGILRSCAWLKAMWDSGKVAIVANAYGAETRDHEHCTIVLDQGDGDAGPNDAGRPGWGGRLAEALGSNVLALTGSPRPFCFGPDPENPLGSSHARLINASDTRSISLYHPAPSESSTWSRRASTARALSAYYTAKSGEMPARATHRRIVDLERKIRQFGEALDDRLATVPIPAELSRLYGGETPALNQSWFGIQIRNLYDSLACNDILDMQVASLEYGNWDTHSRQRPTIEQNFRDLFGRDRALHSLYQVLPADARDNLVLVMAGEFGRQLRDNGDEGTDHGIGNCVLLIGDRVKGGVYGDLFPQSELARLDEDNSPDIAGLTAWDHVFGRVCDFMQPGAGNLVFPNRASRPLEAGVDLGPMF